MDRRSAYSLSVLAPLSDGPDESRTQLQAQLREFILAFQLDNAFIYRYNALRKNVIEVQLMEAAGIR